MGRRGMPGRRRQVLQLDENAKTSYLTQTGCYRPDDMFVESKNSIKTGLSLVGEYSDSDSDSDKETEQNDPDADSKPNGNAEKEEESQLVSENNESLQAEMLEIVGVKKETSADIFLREFQAYQKECSGPAYTREFIAFQKESKEEEEQEVSKSSPLVTSRDVQKESSTKQSQDASSLAKPDHQASSSKLKIPDIDSQVASFLAEIDALGDDDDNEEKVEEPSEAVICDKNSGLDPQPNPQSSIALSNSKIKDKTNGKKATTDGMSKDEPEQKEIKQLTQSLPEEKIVWPEEPITEWQQCYDENTQHCYYWNINTNAVTWEIPPEFTQYLLLYREYEQKVTKLMKEGKTKPSKKKSQKKSEKSKTKQTGSNSGTAPKDSNTQAQLEYGPHLPPSSHNQNDDTSSVSEKTAGSPMNKEAAPKEPEEQPVYGPMVKPNTELEKNKDKQDQSDSSSSPSISNNAENERVEKMQDQQQQHHDDEEEEEEKEEEKEENDGNKVNCKTKRDLSISATDNDNIEKDSTTEGNDSNTFPNENKTEDSLTANLAMIELCKKKFKARISREEENGNPSTQSSSSSSSGGKNTSVLTDFEEGLLDIDEVDRELELALERKKNELKCLEEEEEKLSHETEKRYEKRKYHNDRLSDESSTEEVVPPKSSKRSRDQRSRDHKDSSKHSKKSKHKKDDTNAISSDGSSPLSTTSKKSRSSDQKKSHKSHQSKKESRPKKSKELISKEHDNKLKFFDETEDNKLNELTLDLSQLVMDKMDFLEIDISKQSKLQLLYVQLKTRISDWHAGGLSTKYLYVKLQETNEQLGQYEKSGAPAGWSVNWDRACKRYFYTNNTSGHSQWEYPEKGGNELADDLASVASSSSSLPLPAQPPSFSCPSSEIDQEHEKKVAKDLQRRAKSSSSSEKDKYSSSSKSEGRKEKRSKKESKSSKRSKDSSKSKSHSENSTCSKLKDYDCEMRIYPGEPPPPGTEENLQPSNMIPSICAGESSDLNNHSNNPQLKEESGLKLDQTNVDEEEKDETTLDTVLNESTTKDILDSIAPNNIDDMEIDPEEEIAIPSPALPSTEFKTNSPSSAHNGKTVSVQDSGIIHNTNSSVVISKPPHITRPVQSVEHISGSTDSGLESSARTEAHVSEGSGVSHPSVSGLSELANESSNSPKVVDNNEAPETIKNPKKKKKDKIITSTSLTLKKKNVSSLVQKWQKVKKEVEKEDELARHEFSDGD